MRVNEQIACKSFPCLDVNKSVYLFPQVDLNPQAISLLLISEASPPSPLDHYYAGSGSSFEQTSVLAFNDAGFKVSSINDILHLGVYLTTAVKCAKTAYGIQTDTLHHCSYLLEQEIAQFPNLKAFLLMGDVAIKALNTIATRRGEKRVIPAGSTYKIRSGEFHFQGKRTFPSYLQVGPSFNIEKSKRRMIAQDIASAMSLIHWEGRLTDLTTLHRKY